MFNFYIYLTKGFIIYPIYTFYIISQIIIIFIILRKIINNRVQMIKQRFYLFGISPFLILINMIFLTNLIFPENNFSNLLKILGKTWFILAIIISGIYLMGRIWRLLIRISAKFYSKQQKENKENNLLYLDDNYLRGKLIKKLNNWEKHLEKIQIEKVDISIGESNIINNSLKILQITDLHIGAYFHPDAAYEVIKLANQQNADIVLLTGDFINLDRRLAGISIDILSQLKANLGVYACLGNHEFFTETEDFFDQGLNRNHIILLRNKFEKLIINRKELYILGVDYYKSPMPYKEICKVFKKIQPEKTLVLCHHPNYFPLFASNNVAIMFSGHTHGGQIKFEIGPAVVAPSLFLSPYLHGHYRINQSHLYVSRGIGTSGAPIRILCPPELTIINLNI